MPYVASPGTYVPSRIAVRAVPTRSMTARVRALETDHTVSRDCPSGAQISLVHNVFRSTAVLPLSAVTAREGAIHGTW